MSTDGSVNVDWLDPARESCLIDGVRYENAQDREHDMDLAYAKGWNDAQADRAGRDRPEGMHLFETLVEEYGDDGVPSVLRRNGVQYIREDHREKDYEEIDAGERVEASGHRVWFERGDRASIRVVKILVPASPEPDKETP